MPHVTTSTKEPIVWIHVLRRRANGDPIGMTAEYVSRVPNVGEHLAWDAADYEEGDKAERAGFWRVTHVLHIPAGDAAKVGMRVLAEVWAIEEPSWQWGPPNRELKP